MKKFSAILLALILVLAMTATAFAANDGSITITNTTNGKEYKVYKIFDATYDAAGHVAYTYTGNNDALKTALKAENSPFKYDETTGSVVRKDTVTDDKVVIDWVKVIAGKYGEAVAEETGNGGEISFTDLAYGYYYITSPTGTAVTIDSALPNVTVVDKDEDGPTPPGKTADGVKVSGAQIGDTVNFKITGTLARYDEEAEIGSYTFTDTMDAGLTYNKDLKITVAGKEPVKDTDYTLTETDSGFTLVLTNKDDNGFKFDVDAAYEITYTATLNENAKLEETGNKNEVKLTWNDKTETDTTTTKTYTLVVKKTDGTKSLPGAEFDLYDAETNGKQIMLVKVSDGVYRVATKAEAEAEGFTSAKIEAGTATIKGLDNKSYWLEETKAPDGYNKLAARQEVKVGAGDAHSVDAIVVNNSGSELPSTGGMGTTIFYVVGGLMMAAAVVILVAKKKVAAEK